MIEKKKRNEKTGVLGGLASPLEAINKRQLALWAGLACFRPCVTPRLVGTGPVGCRHIAASATILPLPNSTC